MLQSLTQMRGEKILREIVRYPASLFTMDEVLFLSTHCRRLPGVPVMLVGAFDEPALRELEKIAERVKQVSRAPFTLLSFDKDKV